MVKTEDKPSHRDQGKSFEWGHRRKDEFWWDNTAKETATPGKDLNKEKESKKWYVGSYPGSTQDRSAGGLGKQAAAQLLQTACVMAARQTTDGRWKRLKGRLKATAKTLKLLMRTVLSHFCFLKNKKYIQARLGNFSLFLIPPTLPGNIPY